MLVHSIEVPGLLNAKPEMLADIRQPRFPTIVDIWDGKNYVPIGLPGHEIPESVRPTVVASNNSVQFSLPGLKTFGVALGGNPAEIEKLSEQGVPPDHRTAQVQNFTLEQSPDEEGLWVARFRLPEDTPPIDRFDGLCLGALVCKYLSIAASRLPWLEKSR